MNAKKFLVAMLVLISPLAVAQAVRVYEGKHVASPLGTAGAPAYTFVGDPNTGIYSSAADTLSFAANGNEEMRLTASTLTIGNAIASAPTGTGVLTLAGTVDGATTQNFYRSDNAGVGAAAIILNRTQGTLASPTVVSSGDALANIIGKGMDGTAGSYQEAARIRFSVDGTPGTGDMPGRIEFHTTADGASTPTERLRINSSGNASGTGAWTLGSTSASTNHFLNSNSTSASVLSIENHNATSGAEALSAMEVIKGPNVNTAGNNHFIVFRINGGSTNSGLIASNGANAAAFFNSSDRRLKKNIVDLTDPLSKILALRPVSYQWKSDDSTGTGFIAQELFKVLPKYVVHPDDGEGTTDGDDIPPGGEPWLLTEGGMMAYVVGAIKQLKGLVDKGQVCTRRSASFQASVSAEASALCNAGERIMSGGCQRTYGAGSLIGSLPSGERSWQCDWTSRSDFTVYGICCQ